MVLDYPFADPSGSMVVDIGGGTTELLFILGGVVHASSIRIGGDTWDDAIVNFMRGVHKLAIGEASAEKKLKLQLVVQVFPEDGDGEINDC